MATTYKIIEKDGHLFCETHGDLGTIEEALRGHKRAMYGEGEYYCMECIGEDVAASEENEHG